MQCVEQVSELPACGGAGVEHRARIGRDGGEQEVDVAESFREGGGSFRAQRVESRLGGRLGVRGGTGRWRVHASSLTRTAPARKTRRDPVDGRAPMVPPHLLLPLPRPRVRRPGDIAECYADPSKAKRELGWVAEYGIDDMCADSWNWQKNNPDGYHTVK